MVCLKCGTKDLQIEKFRELLKEKAMVELTRKQKAMDIMKGGD